MAHAHPRCGSGVVRSAGAPSDERRVFAVIEPQLFSVPEFSHLVLGPPEAPGGRRKLTMAWHDTSGPELRVDVYIDLSVGEALDVILGALEVSGYC